MWHHHLGVAVMLSYWGLALLSVCELLTVLGFVDDDVVKDLKTMLLLSCFRCAMKSLSTSLFSFFWHLFISFTDFYNCNDRYFTDDSEYSARLLKTTYSHFSKCQRGLVHKGWKLVLDHGYFPWTKYDSMSSAKHVSLLHKTITQIHTSLSLEYMPVGVGNATIMT